MFRFHFNTRTCLWEIQFLVWGLFWRAAKTPEFQNIDQATKWARERGLDKVYDQQGTELQRLAHGNGAQRP